MVHLSPCLRCRSNRLAECIKSEALQQEKKRTHLGDVCKVVSGSSLPGEGLEERDDRVSRGFVFVLRWWSAAWEVEPVEHTHKQYQRTALSGKQLAKSWRGGFRRLEIQFGDAKHTGWLRKVDFIQFGQCLDLFTHRTNTKISEKKTCLIVGPAATM